jgi:hypothetical protein
MGTLYILRADPKEFVLTGGGDRRFVETVGKMYEQRAGAEKLAFKNSFYLERGHYVLAATLDEGVSGEPYIVTGSLIDLFDPKLPVYKSKSIQPGEQGFFLNVDRIKDRRTPRVLASASRIYDERTTANSYSFTAKSPSETAGALRALLPGKPNSVHIDGLQKLDAASWDAVTSTCMIEFENSPEGIGVEFQW